MKQQKESQEPELLEHSYLEEENNGNTKGKTYIYILLIVFVILSFIWKGFISERLQNKDQDVSTISQSSDLMK